MKYSVIIPIYNAEKTLHRCIGSLLAQTPFSTEILLINDGSTDGSDAICRDYCDQYSCIRYFSQENKGVSAARNVGLDHASGKYVLFVDSDDYVSEHYFETIDRTLSKTDAELLFFQYQRTNSDIPQAYLKPKIVDKETEVAELLSRMMMNRNLASLWSKVFQRKVIEKENIRFNTNLRIGEDLVFVFTFSTFIQKTVTISDTLYYVSVDNLDSLSRKSRDYVADHLFVANMEMFNALNRAKKTDLVKRIIERPLSHMYYRSVYSAAKEMRKFPMTSKERREKIQMVCQMYSEKRITPCGILGTVTALPVLLCSGGMVDFAVGCAEWFRLGKRKS